MGLVLESLAGTVDGANVTFTITSAPKAASIIVSDGNLLVTKVASGPQIGEYSISGTTITMGLAPRTGSKPWARYDT